jgi:hypothetical protein
MHFKLGQNDNGYPTPVIDDADINISNPVFEKLRLFEGIDERSAQSLVELLNAVASTAYSLGYDEGWENGSNSGSEDI